MISSRRISGMFVLAFSFCLVFSSGFAQVTAPEDYFGYKPGADYKLITHREAMSYLELTADQTARMQVQDMGPTSMGQRMKYLIISSEMNMANLERYREMAEKLSLARGVSKTEAEWLADNGKAVAWIDGGLHATECAPSQHLIQLAYDLVTGEDGMTRNIRENVITLLVFANPDGMDLVGDWYMKHVGTPYERRMPWLYHKYIGHDNNRDSFNASQLETQNISRVQNHEWFPNVVYNHHQTAPFPTRIWIPPYGEPTNPNKPAMVIRLENLIGAAMGQAFEAADQPGAISRVSFDAWYPGFVTQIVTTHNIPSILTETALYGLATPHEYTAEDIRGAYEDLTKSAFYPNPWEGGWWRLGDAVDYCLTASKAVLDVTARYSRDMLISKYKMASDYIETYKNEPPYGWIIPQEQYDPTTTARMLEKLMLLGVEVYTAEESFTSAGEQYPAGTYVIPVSQPFAMYVKTMMEKQDYPDLRKYTHLWQGIVSRVRIDSSVTGPLRPYDVAGWTFPIQMGVDYYELDSAVSFSITRLTEPVYPQGTVSGNRGEYVFSPTDNNSFIAVNRIFDAGGNVSRALESFTAGGVTYPLGTFIAKDIKPETIEKIADETHIPMTHSGVNVKTKELKPLRVGHYGPWSGSMDEGWMRWILEQYEFPYQTLRPEDVRDGDLNKKVDVITFASLNARSIINGNREGSTLPEYVGGITEEGVEHLKKFVADGGILVCNMSSCDFAMEQFDLPVSNVMRQAGSAGFYAAGSLMKMDYDTDNPVAYGMPERGIAFFSRGHLFEINPDSAATVNPDLLSKVVARFADEPLLLSGYVERDEIIRGKPAVLDAPYGEGRIILFGFSFHNRAQAHATFKLFFNSLYYR